MNSSFLALIFALSAWFSVQGQIVDTKMQVENDRARVTFSVKLPPKNYLYKEYVQLTSDHPELTITSWRAMTEPVEQYDNSFKEIKKVYEGTVPFEVFVTRKTEEPITHAALHFIYHSNDIHNQVEDLLIPLKFGATESSSDLSDQKEQPKNAPVVCKVVSAETTNTPAAVHEKEVATESWSAYLSRLITRQESIWLRFLLVFLLGFLLSLTPCIYPMIPVTIGVLQASVGTSRSLMRNFLVALAYTSGLSMTFALFGLLASCVGPLCGQLLMNTYFVIVLVLILLYFALSMLGFYDIKLPTFSSSQKHSNNSFLAAFLFGAASGTFSSPCVSPGLALLLSLVATWGSKIMGFVYLFIFGVGLSIPLLLIGTLSSLVNFLPRAGIWMIEVKRLFGVLMIGASLFYLSFIVSLPVFYGISSVSLLLLAFLYLVTATRLHRTIWRPLSYGLAFFLIIGACVAGFYAGKTFFITHEKSAELVPWRASYQGALSEAAQAKKLLFIDLWAPYCSVCVAINKKVLVHPDVATALDRYIPVKIDMANQQDSQVQFMREKFDVVGVPVFMVVDPETSQVIKKWGAELYGMPITAVVQELNQARTRE